MVLYSSKSPKSAISISKLAAELKLLATKATDSSLDDIALIFARGCQRLKAPTAACLRQQSRASRTTTLAADSITAACRRGGRPVSASAGRAGRLVVLDTSECPPTIGTDPLQVVGVLAGAPSPSPPPSKAPKKTKQRPSATSTRAA